MLVSSRDSPRPGERGLSSALQATFALLAALLDPRHGPGRGRVASDTQGTRDRPVVARARQDRRRRWSWKAASVTPCRPAGGRRCSMSTATSVLGGSPPASAARSWAPTRSRCPGRGNGTPAPPAPGLGDPPPAAGQVEQGHAHPPATPRSRLAQPGRARLGAGGCGALPQPEVRHPPGVLVGDALASPTTRSRPGRGRRRRSPAWPPDAGPDGRGGDGTLGPTHPARPGASAATRAARASVPGVRPWPAWTADHRAAGSCRRAVPARHQHPRRSRSPRRRGMTQGPRQRPTPSRSWSWTGTAAVTPATTGHQPPRCPPEPARAARASRTQSAGWPLRPAPHPLAVDREPGVPATDRDQGALAPREAGVPLADLAAMAAWNQAPAERWSTDRARSPTAPPMSRAGHSWQSA